MSAVAAMQGILTIDEVASHLQVNRKTVSKLIGSGKLAAFRVGREYRILESDLEDYIRRERVTHLRNSGEENNRA
jgi:excisionase family DNA binding protein